ncbi:MAG TPA: addiction module protein [Longimicrobium sp.]|jgi:putative addiction module component (TIGR02574 family)
MPLTADQINGLTAAQLTEAALRLPEEQREAIVDALLASLVDQELDAAQVAELERRSEELRTGKVKGIPAEEALRQLDEIAR